jgi:hypothetical protein
MLAFLFADSKLGYNIILEGWMQEILLASAILFLDVSLESAEIPW